MAQVSVVGPDGGEPIQFGPTRMRILEDGSTTGHRRLRHGRSDPSRASRIARDPHPGAVGRSDGIADVGYGRAYAAAIPMARFQLLPDTGHSPQLETPDQVIHAIWDSADTGFSAVAR